MIRTSKHTTKFANNKKQAQLETVLKDYKIALQEYINLILDEKLPLSKFLSTKQLPDFENVNIQLKTWRLIIYENAYSIIKSRLVKVKNKTFKRYQYLYARCKQHNKHSYFLNKKYSELNINYLKRIGKIEIKNVTINLNCNLFDIKQLESEFDEFVRIKLPYIYKKGLRKFAQTINIPIKHHRQSLKFKNNEWIRKNTVGFDGKNIIFYWEKEEVEKLKGTNNIGIDIGYKKLISTSTQNHYGIELTNVYDKLGRQKQGSINFKQTLVERDKLINQYCNEFNRTENFNTVFIEDLKNVKKNSKKNSTMNSKSMNKLQRWTYPKVIGKLERLSEEEGFYLHKVNPAYTSRRCSKCGVVNKSNRKGDIYSCTCGMVLDADINAAMNILHRGVYNLSAAGEQL